MWQRVVDILLQIKVYCYAVVLSVSTLQHKKYDEIYWHLAKTLLNTAEVFWKSLFYALLIFFAEGTETMIL